MSLEDQLAEVESAEMVDLDLADEDPRPKRARQQNACDVMPTIASCMWPRDITSDTFFFFQDINKFVCCGKIHQMKYMRI